MEKGCDEFNLQQVNFYLNIGLIKKIKIKIIKIT